MFASYPLDSVAPELIQVEAEGDQITVYTSFEKMELDENLLRGVFGLGFERPSAIQQRGIVPIKIGRDCIIQAQSGTGKTATFAIGSLCRVDSNCLETQVLMLAPTRELACQIQHVVTSISQPTTITSKACIGGTQVQKDIQELRSKPHVVVGTPGRVFDMIQKRQALDPNKIRVFILDEADEMLSRGFKDQIYDIFQLLPETIQVVLVSATMPPDVLEVTSKFMRKPISILVKNDELTLEGIRQYHIKVVEDKWKFETLTDIYTSLQVSQSVIFCNSRSRVEDLAKRLAENKFVVSAIHGEMEQSDRTQVLRHFRDGVSRILISTDLLARGIDVQQVSLVINYDLPSSLENYLHRIGRGGRFGRKGTAINFVPNDQLQLLDDIASHYSTHIPEIPANISDVLNS